MSTVDPFGTVKIVSVRAYGKFMCLLSCAEPLYFHDLAGQALTLERLVAAVMQHLVKHHPVLAVEMMAQLRGSIYDRYNHPERQDASGMTEPCQPIGCDNGIHRPGCPYAGVDSAEQVDPLNLRGRYQP